MASFRKQSINNTNPELHDPNLFHRDSRPWPKKLKSFINHLFPMLLAVLGVTLLFFPEQGDFIFAFAIGLKLYSSNDNHDYPFEAPEWETYVAKESLGEALKNGRLLPKRKMGKGTLIFGREYLLRRLLVSNPDMETRHSLVLGSTGSGKTQLILSMLFQALLQPGGTSAVVVDGKADIALFWTIFGILKRIDRLHDLLVLNYLTPQDSLDTTNMHDEDRISNNMNIYNHGTPDQMKTITMGLGRESEGGDAGFWEGRSSTMIGAAFHYLAYERDVEGLDLNVQVVREFLVLKNMLKKAARSDVPLKYRLPLQQYLKTLPSINDSMFTKTEQEIDEMDIYPKADEQHIYCVMMVSETMSDLSETMGHIFVTKLSEVNMTDVCLGGRVLLVLLPSIAKNPDAVSALGRLLLQGLRPVLMRAAGYKIQGNRIVTLENRPSNAKYPVRLFFDEYGMYAVKGFYVLVALVRSYGFHCLFGAQTAGMFQKVCGKEEYEALMGNLNNKFILKNEDHGESLSLAVGRTGKILAANQDRIEHGLAGATHDNDDVRVQEKDVVNATMLASAEPGEGLYIYGGETHAFKATRFHYPETQTSRLNYFAQVLNPSQDEVEKVKKAQLLGYEKYVEAANDYIDDNIEMLEFEELKQNISEIQALNFTKNVSQEMMLAIGLSVYKSSLENDESTDSDESTTDPSASGELSSEQEISNGNNRNHNDIERPTLEGSDNDIHDYPMNFDEALLEIAEQDAELQLSTMMEYEDSFDSGDEFVPDLSDFSYSGYEERVESEEVYRTEMGSGLDDMNSEGYDTSEFDDPNQIDLSSFSGFGEPNYEALDYHTRNRFVSANISNDLLDDALEHNQGSVEDTSINLNVLAGMSESDALESAKEVKSKIEQVLSYPPNDIDVPVANKEIAFQLAEETLKLLKIDSE